MKKTSCFLAVAVAASVFSPRSAHALQRTWDGNSSVNLLDAANWVGGAAPVSNSDGMLFNAAGSSGTNLTLNTAGTFQVTNAGGALVFSNLASAYTIAGQAGSTELIYGTGAIVNNSSNTQTFNVAVRRNSSNPLTIGANNGSLVFGNTFNFGGSGGTAFISFGATTGGSVIFNGNLITGGGTGGLTINNSTGSGTVQINGSSNTGFSGTLSIGSNNTVRVGNAAGLNNLSLVLMTGSNITMINDGASAIATNASLSISAASGANNNFTFGESGDTSANNISFNGTTAISADLNRTITINGTGVTVSSASVWNNSSLNSRTMTVDGAGNTFQIAGIGIGATGETANRSFTVAGTGNLTVTGGITNGAGTGTRALSLTGSGIVTTSGTSDYNGTTSIGSTGTLLVNGTHAGGTTYTVNGTLGGTGAIDTSASNGAVNVSATGRLQASSLDTLSFNTGTGALNVSGALGAGTPSMLFTLGAPGSEVIDQTGLLTIGSGLLEWNDFSFTAGVGFNAGVYTLFDYTTLIGTLGGSLSGTISGLNATISNDVGNSAIILTVVPEPGTALLFGLGLGVVTIFRRRRA